MPIFGATRERGGALRLIRNLRSEMEDFPRTGFDYLCLISGWLLSTWLLFEKFPFPRMNAEWVPDSLFVTLPLFLLILGVVILIWAMIAVLVAYPLAWVCRKLSR